MVTLSKPERLSQRPIVSLWRTIFSFTVTIKTHWEDWCWPYKSTLLHSLRFQTRGSVRPKELLESNVLQWQSKQWEGQTRQHQSEPHEKSDWLSKYFKIQPNTRT